MAMDDSHSDIIESKETNENEVAIPSNAVLTRVKTPTNDRKPESV